MCVLMPNFTLSNPMSYGKQTTPIRGTGIDLLASQTLRPTSAAPAATAKAGGGVGANSLEPFRFGATGGAGFGGKTGPLNVDRTIRTRVMSATSYRPVSREMERYSAFSLGGPTSGEGTCPRRFGVDPNKSLLLLSFLFLIFSSFTEPLLKHNCLNNTTYKQVPARTRPAPGSGAKRTRPPCPTCSAPPPPPLAPPPTRTPTAAAATPPLLSTPRERRGRRACPRNGTAL
jgi:hypothetical protein